MKRTVQFAPEALAHAARAASWWRENRGSVPDLFERELAHAQEMIAGSPETGAPYSHPRRSAVRRVLLPRSQYYLYYRFDEGAVSVLAIWSTAGGHGPRL